MTALEAAQYCRENNVSKKFWSCGYVVEVDLELDHNIKLIGEDAWVCLENELYYNDMK